MFGLHSNIISGILVDILANCYLSCLLSYFNFELDWNWSNPTFTWIELIGYVWSDWIPNHKIDIGSDGLKTTELDPMPHPNSKRCLIATSRSSGIKWQNV